MTAAIIAATAIAGGLGLLAWRARFFEPRPISAAVLAAGPLPPELPSAAGPEPQPSRVKPQPSRVNPQPSRVHVEIRTLPPHCELVLDGRPLPNPFSGSFAPSPAVHSLTATASGYRARNERVAFDQARRIAIRLAPVAKPPPPARIRPDAGSTPLITTYPE